MCAVVALAFAACSDDDGNDDPVLEKDLYSYYGNIVVDQTDGTFFTCENVKIDLAFDKENKTVKMVVNKVKFAEQMPVELDMTVEGLKYTIDGDDVHLVGNDIVPTAMGGPFPAYTITNFVGEVELAGIQEYEFRMVCGKFPVRYKGFTR